MPPVLTFHGSLFLCRETLGGGCGTTALRQEMPFSSSSQSPIDEASPKFQRPYFGSGLGGPTTTYPSSSWETRATWRAPGRCHWRVCILSLCHDSILAISREVSLLKSRLTFAGTRNHLHLVPRLRVRVPIPHTSGPRNLFSLALTSPPRPLAPSTSHLHHPT